MRRDGALQAFDCIEFDVALRHIDVWADVAFLFMDLSSRDREDLAYAFVDGYLNRTGDYGGAGFLGFFSCYRAMVRAKVNALRHRQSGEINLLDAIGSALRWVEDRQRRDVGKIVIAHGLSGSGKSYWSRQLLSAYPLLRLRSDVVRKVDFGIALEASSNSDVAGGIYESSSSDHVYEDLAAATRALISNGENVLVDATFLLKKQRRMFGILAQRCHTTLTVIDFQAPAQILRERIAGRRRAGKDVSEAGEGVLDWQMQHQEPIADSVDTIVFDTVNGTLNDLIQALESTLQN
jgi:predicted kinase